MHYILLVAFAGLFSSSGSSASPAPAKEASAPHVDDWLTYEDDMFKAQYPPGSDVSGKFRGKQDPANIHLFIVPLPHARLTGTGGLMLQRDKITKNMLLRDALQSDIIRYKKERGALLIAPRDVPVKNGRCISALITAPAQFCPKNTGSCFAPFRLTQCDGPNGERYNANTFFSVGPSRDALSPQAQKEAATYERMLRSLEFKKP